MQHPGNFVVIGPARWGKTTVLSFMARERQKAGDSVYALHVKPEDWTFADWRTRRPARMVQELEKRMGHGRIFAVLDDTISFKRHWENEELGLSRIFTDFPAGGIQVACVGHRYKNVIPTVVRANAVNVIAFQMPKSDAKDLADDRVCKKLELAAYLGRYQFILLFDGQVGCFETTAEGGYRQIPFPEPVE